MPLPDPPSNEGDLEMMAAVAAKDERAQHAVIARLARRVRRITSMLSNSAADAEDASQLALLEILASAEGFRVATSLEHWADRITVRTTLRIQRRERSRRNSLARWLAPGTQPWGSSTHVGSGEQIGMSRLVAKLPEARRQALVLRHALGYSVEEIAELTSCPVGTVKDRLVSGRKQLRKLLETDARRARVGRAR